jgi:hypothetical protein
MWLFISISLIKLAAQQVLFDLALLAVYSLRYDTEYLQRVYL